jgi:hypothetical protein
MSIFTVPVCKKKKEKKTENQLMNNKLRKFEKEGQ